MPLLGASLSCFFFSVMCVGGPTDYCTNARASAAPQTNAQGDDPASTHLRTRFRETREKGMYVRLLAS